jgi:hypothetical protein
LFINVAIQGDEPELLRVVVEAVPEDEFRFIALKGRVAVPAPRGDEVDGVVTVPVLESVLPVDVLVLRARALSEATHGDSFRRREVN